MTTEHLYGRRPVYETLRAGRRSFKRLYIAENATDLDSIRTLADARSVPVSPVPVDVLNSRVRGANHQSVVLSVSAYPYEPLDALLEAAAVANEPPLLLFLDLLQDVQNVGTLLRTADAVGVHGVIIQERRAASITPAVVSTSSGAVEHLNVVQVTNLVRTMKQLKDDDLWLAGLDLEDDAVRYDQAGLSGGLGLVVGSEGEGLRRLVRETCDFIIYLPMRGQIASLNAATAGSVALYAAWQARQFRGEGSRSLGKTSA